MIQRQTPSSGQEQSQNNVITEPLSNRFQLSNSNPVVSPPSKLFENISQSKLAKLEKKAEHYKKVNVKLNKKKAKCQTFCVICM